MQLRAIARHKNTYGVANCAQLFERNFLRHGVAVAQIQTFEQLAPSKLAVNDVKTHCKTIASCVLCGFHLRFVHYDVIPTSRHRILCPRVWGNISCVKIKQCHENSKVQLAMRAD